MTLYKRIEGTNNTLEIYFDNYAETPRAWDNLAQMIFVGNYEYLGDKHSVEFPDFEDRQDFIDRGAEIVKKQLNAAIIVPIHLYNHSGISISTSYSYPYNCPWDSGTIGFAVITKEKLYKEYSVKRVNKKLLEKANRILEGEINILNDYISGNVFGFKLFDKKDNNEVDSCWSFYGTDMNTNGISDHINDEEIKEMLK